MAVNVWVNSGDYLSRQEMLKWVNGMLHTDFKNIQQFQTGSLYSQLLQILFPASDLSVLKLKFKGTQEQSSIHNFKAVQNFLDKIGIQKDIPIEKLVSGNFIANFEFAQWFRKLFEVNSNNNHDTGNSRDISPSPSSVVRKNAPKPRTQMSPQRTSGAGWNVFTNDKGKVVLVLDENYGHCMVHDVDHQHPDKGNHHVTPKGGANPRNGQTRPVVSAHSISYQKQTLHAELTDARQEIEIVAKERNFYFGKLRQMELLCLDEKEKGDPALDKILDLIYATKVGFGIEEEEEEEENDNVFLY